MATIQELKELALHSVRGTAPANYTAETVDEALRGEIATMCGSINNFNRNKYDIFEIIITAADEVVPNKVIDAMGMFAEVKQVAQGQKAMFKRGLVGRNRAKKFLTQVAASGVYETFRLDSDTFEVAARAIGGGASIDFERFLDGAESMSDLMDVITEGLVDAAYGEVQKCLIAAYEAAGRPEANSNAKNSATVNTFDANEMVKLLNVVKAYGGNAAIFATPEFISAMGADAIAANTYADDDINSIHNTGKIKIFRGAPVVELPQSFTDESNTETVINPQYAYILPTGKERVVKIVFEGETQVWDHINRDQSIEIMAYKKMGAAILTHHNWAIYKNTSL